MRGDELLVVPDSLVGELRTLLQVYRGRAVFSEGEAGVAVVLGAQVLPGGRPSGTLKARTRHAARLYASGRVRLLIPTGGVGEYPPSEAEVAASILRGAGVSKEAILPEGEAKNTRESARLVAAMARGRGIQSLLLVTDPLHCVRSVGAFRAEGMQVCASPAYDSPTWREPWLRRGHFLREIAAILWYRARRKMGAHFRP